MLLSIQDFMADNYYTPSFDNYAARALETCDPFGFQVQRAGVFLQKRWDVLC